MRAVDLFSGCGGLSLGLKNAGFDIVAAYEYWKPALEIYRQNFLHPIFEFDLSRTREAYKHIIGFQPDIIVGGPPCQDFSSAGKRNENGGRGDLTISFAKIVSLVKPDWFLMENVDRIQKTEVFKIAKNILSDAGYGLTQIVLDASLCGVPQKRKRMFLIGNIASEENFLKNNLIGKLAKEGMTIRDYVGNSLNVEHYYRHARSYARRGVFSIDEPSPTIRGVNRPIPPNYQSHNGDSTTDLSIVRPLTTIERSYIQTFPKTFIWDGVNKTNLEQLIGNAVPVNLAKFVGTSIMDYNLKSSSEFHESLKCI